MGGARELNILSHNLYFGSGLSSISDGKSAILIAGVKRTANHGTKSLTTSGSPNVAQSAITNQSTIEAGIHTLERADVFKLLHVYMAPDFSTVATDSHTDIKEYYDLKKEIGITKLFFINKLINNLFSIAILNVILAFFIIRR